MLSKLACIIIPFKDERYWHIRCFIIHIFFLQGMYNILSLKGGYILADAKREHKETHYMNIILSTGDGTRTFGGPMAGSLIATTDV